MKNRIFVILIGILSLSVLVGEAKPRAMYIHHSNGEFNAFLFAEIDSIRYSAIDVDSILRDEPVTQEIWTRDSVYRFAVTQIDSIAFQTPPTVLKDKVIDLTGPIGAYVVSVDGMTLVMSNGTPEGLMPHVGDKLIAWSIEDKFGGGFVGEVAAVSSVNGAIAVSCSEISLDDIYERFYYADVVGIESVEADEASPDAGRKTKSSTPVSPYDERRFQLPEQVLNLDWSETGTFQSNDKFAFGGGGGVSLKVQRTGVVGRIYIKDGRYKYERNYIGLETVKTVSLNGKGTLSWGDDFPMANGERPLPYFPFVQFYVEGGITVSASLSLGIEGTISKRYHTYLSCENDNGRIRPLLEHGAEQSQAEGNMTLDGEVGVGIYGELGFKALCRDLLSVGCRVEGGVKLSSSKVLLSDELTKASTSTEPYTSLLGEGTITLSPYLSGSGFYTYLGNKSDFGMTKAVEQPLFRQTSVPNFYRISVSPDGNGASVASCRVKGWCTTPRRVGFATLQEGADSPTLYWFEDKYLTPASFDRYSMTIPTPADDVTVYPVVEMMPGKPMLATPSWPDSSERNRLYPFITDMVNGGVRVTSGMVNISSGADNGTSVQEGNFFPFKVVNNPELERNDK